MNVQPGDFLLANPVGTPVDVVAVGQEGVTVAQTAYASDEFVVPWDMIGPEPHQWTHHAVR